MAERPVILLLRQDLRLADHPALAAAIERACLVVPLYVLDDEAPGRWRMGGASRWWLGTSLPRLAEALRAIGSRLIVRQGPTIAAIMAVARETGASAVHLTRSYEPWAVRLERDLKAALAGEGVELRRFAGSVLFEPEALRTQAGEPYRVYSPFARAALALPPPRRPLAAPGAIPAPARWPASTPIESLGLLPTRPDWAGGLRAAWTPGETGAAQRLERFLAGPIGDYKELRDRPDLEATSRLSPHLHFGELSAATAWHAAQSAAAAGRASAAAVEKFCRELLWREFSYHLLCQFPALPEAPFRPEFRAFPWVEDARLLEAWQRGRTGYPIVDAAMRELWTTGYMHNRARMIAASFLVKDLLVPWQAGAAWFWDTLVDADLANNAAGWQWVAGSGADAAPYFRIFNPVKQGQTFDPEGTYVRRWLPEIGRLAAPFVHAPFEAPAAALAAAGVVLGQTYPRQIVDHKAARARALAAFQRLTAA